MNEFESMIAMFEGAGLIASLRTSGLLTQLTASTKRSGFRIANSTSCKNSPQNKLYEELVLHGKKKKEKKKRHLQLPKQLDIVLFINFHILYYNQYLMTLLCPIIEPIDHNSQAKYDNGKNKTACAKTLVCLLWAVRHRNESQTSRTFLAYAAAMSNSHVHGGHH